MTAPRVELNIVIPVDAVAEEAAAAIAIMSSVGASRMNEIAGDVYDVRIARLLRLVHAASWRVGDWPLHEAEIVSSLAGIPLAIVRGWLRSCPVYTDDTGSIRRRIRDAAARRREVERLLEVLEQVAA